MVYNERKRSFEKTTGIFGIVFSALQIIVLLSLLIVILGAPEGFYNGEHGKIIANAFFKDSIVTTLLFVSIYVALFSILMIIFSAQLIKSPVSTDKTQISKRNGVRICTLVFSILSGQGILIVLTIIMLCMKDFVPEETQVYLVEKKPVTKTQQASPAAKVTPTKPKENKVLSIEEKIAKVKQLKELGVIDEETYKNAVQKIINDYV